MFLTLFLSAWAVAKFLANLSTSLFTLLLDNFRVHTLEDTDFSCSNIAFHLELRLIAQTFNFALLLL